MERIVLVHGYSAESREDDRGAITGIYGDLPAALREAYGQPTVVDVDVSRYVTLEDGITLDDLSLALDRALRDHGLLDEPFHVIAHSTGALVVRNWLRHHTPRPSPVGNIVYMAGAQFGSGWAHLGRGQLAKWGRRIFQEGTERGVRVLDALELGSSSTLDLHLQFLLQPGMSMVEDLQVCEYVICGTQADPDWFMLPIRYAKEDGSDGVIRASAANLNFNYQKLVPTEQARGMTWEQVLRQVERARSADTADGSPPIALYEAAPDSQHSSDPERDEIPFAIPFACAHSGDDHGVVTGHVPREQVLRLLRHALEADSTDRWRQLVGVFREETELTYQRAADRDDGGWLARVWSLVEDPHAQYDPHAQVVIRVRDQHGRPVDHYDVFFSSGTEGTPMRRLLEDNHVNAVTPNVIVFYLRTGRHDGAQHRVVDRLPDLAGLTLLVTAVEPQTEQVRYLPARFDLDRDSLKRWIQPHRTTIIDIELLRVTGPDMFQIVSAG